MTSASPYSEVTESEGNAATGSAAMRNRREIKSLPQRDPPNEKHSVLHGAHPAPDVVAVHLHQEAIRQLDAHSHSDTIREVGGVLLGHAFRYEAQLFVDVKAALPAESDDHGPFHFTFNADAWSQIHRDRAAEHPDLEIVGWFHTHPGLGVFYSADDVIVHSAAFVMPWHVGLVLDPLRKEAAFFGWRDGALAPLSGFYEITAEKDERTLAWRAVQTAIWEETYEADLSKQVAGRQVEERGMPAAVHPWLGVLVGALGVFLSLGLIFGGMLPMYANTRALERLAIALVEEKMAQANDSGVADCPDTTVRLLAPLPGQTVGAGESLAIVGTANHSNAARYQIAIRPAGVQDWSVLRVIRRDVTIGQLMEVDTSAYADGAYQLRLTALNRSEQPVSGVSACTIDFSLARSTGEKP